MKQVFLWGVLLAVLGAAPAMAANSQTRSNDDIVRTTSTVYSSIIQGRIAAIVAPAPDSTARQMVKSEPAQSSRWAFSLDGDELGLSSGEDGHDYGVWGMGAYTDFSSRHSGDRYDADAYNFLVGADMRVTRKLLLGLAAGYGDMSLDKDNWDSGTDDGSLSSEHEWTVMPYAAYNITDLTIVDAAFAYTGSRYKDDDGTDVGRYDSDRYMTNLGISQYYVTGNWLLSGRAGYMYVHGDLSSYSRGTTDVANPDSYLGQLNMEAKGAYFFNTGMEPYGALRYYLDTSTSSQPVNSDYDEFEGVLGMNWYLAEQFLFNLEGGASMDRSQFESYRGQFNLRYIF